MSCHLLGVEKFFKAKPFTHVILDIPRCNTGLDLRFNGQNNVGELVYESNYSFDYPLFLISSTQNYMISNTTPYCNNSCQNNLAQYFSSAAQAAEKQDFISKLLD